jgi:hypothetical protein
MSKADQFRQYADEAMRWACQSKNEKETGPDRACAYMDASCVSEREHCGRQPQSARAQGLVTPPQLADFNLANAWWLPGIIWRAPYGGARDLPTAGV